MTIESIIKQLNQLTSRGLNVNYTENNLEIKVIINNQVLKNWSKIIYRSRIIEPEFNIISKQLDEIIRLTQPNCYISESEYNQLWEVYSRCKINGHEFYLELSQDSQMDSILFWNNEKDSGYYTNAAIHPEKTVNGIYLEIMKILTAAA